MNALDKIIGYLAPRQGLQRARARLAIELVREYEAAKKGSRRNSKPTKASSANTSIQKALPAVRSRHRELVENNPWAARAVQQLIPSLIVGYGITGEVQGAGTKKLATKWIEWAESSACDAMGAHDIYGLQAQVATSTAEGGDCIAVREQQRDGSIKIRLLEGDYIDHTKTGIFNGKTVIQGVQFGPLGVESYWLFKQHPGEVISTRNSLTSEPVSADNVAHVFRRDRIGQARGVPWGVQAVITLDELDGYEDAYLFRQKLANCFMAFVTDSSPDIAGTSVSLPMPETMEPGLIGALPSGKTVEFAEPPSAGEYGPYTRDVLYRVAATYGVSYESLTGDYSKVNFTSGRMGKLQEEANVERWRWHMVIPMFCERVATWWLESMSITGNRVDTARFVWTPPPKQMVQPDKETAALKDQLRNGLKSLPQVHREYGVHTDQLFQEIADTNKKLDELGIKLDCDARNAPSTKAPAEPAKETEQETDE